VVPCEDLAGDINGDQVVSMDDFYLIADQFGETCGASCSHLTADINRDRVVNLDDFYILNDQFGDTCGGFDETRVRYLLADMMVGGHPCEFKNVTDDPDSVEAFSRWSRGIFPRFYQRYERIIIDGIPKVVCKGTMTEIDGSRVGLTSDREIIGSDMCADTTDEDATRGLGTPDSISPNTPPEADAGSDRTVGIGSRVELDGSGSRDADGDVLRYRWTAVPEITLSSDRDMKPHFSAATAGTYTFSLVVTDGQANSAPDEVVVTVLEPTGPSRRTGETITVDLPGGGIMELVWIESGTFTMGSPSSEPGWFSNEGPQHQVTISRGFYLGKYELTQGQWESVMGTRPWSGQDYVQEDANHPAVYISWEDVQELISRLNEAAGEELYRLPTEAEWEYACRAGTTTSWSFGDDEGQLEDYMWYAANTLDAGLEYAQPVGTKLPNPWGLYDVHGNVWEWVQDWYGNYSSESQRDPTGPASGAHRASRGGSFLAYARYVRSGYRSYNLPDFRYGGIGARLLRME